MRWGEGGVGGGGGEVTGGLVGVPGDVMRMMGLKVPEEEGVERVGVREDEGMGDDGRG